MNDFFVKKRSFPSKEDLLKDISGVMQRLGKSSLTMKEYDTYGRYDVSTALRKIGKWSVILQRLNSPLNVVYHTDDDLLENIKVVWLKKGRQPTRRDMDDKSLSAISSGAYLRHFGSWYNALDSFSKYITQDLKPSTNQIVEIYNGYKHTTKRIPNDRLKVQVLMRDGNRCRICGAVCDGGLNKIHFDHIKPWSKGGETTLDNLQVLCSDCNTAIGNLDKEDH